MADLRLDVGGGDRVLVCAPHQDDESIGCGGTIARWAGGGADVGVLWISGTDAGEVVGVEALAALEVLGVNWHSGLGHAPVGLESNERNLLEVVAAFREFRPDIVMIPHSDEDDRQHRVTSELCYEAGWLASYPYPKSVAVDAPKPPRLMLAYEVWTPIRRPSLYIDVTAEIDTKGNAIAEYSSQEEISRFSQAAVALNRYRGEMSGVAEYAEAFSIVKGVAS